MTLLLQSLLVSLCVLGLILALDKCAGGDHLERKDWPVVVFVSLLWPLGLIFVLCGAIVIFGDD